MKIQYLFPSLKNGGYLKGALKAKIDSQWAKLSDEMVVYGISSEEEGEPMVLSFSSRRVLGRNVAQWLEIGSEVCEFRMKPSQIDWTRLTTSLYHTYTYDGPLPYPVIKKATDPDDWDICGECLNFYDNCQCNTCGDCGRDYDDCRCQDYEDREE